jgi:hypothetical protein
VPVHRKVIVRMLANDMGLGVIVSVACHRFTSVWRGLEPITHRDVSTIE